MRQRKINNNHEARIAKMVKEFESTDFYIERVKSLEKFKKIAANPESKEVLTYDFTPETKNVRLVPLFDIHYGSKGCNIDLLDQYLDYILNTRDCYTFLGGDLCETATKESVGRSIFEEDLHAGDQRRELTDRLLPLAEAGKILGGISGNHEMRLSRFADDDPMVELCYDLDIPYCGFSGYLDIQVNDIHYTVAIHHGVGGGATPGGRANSAAKLTRVALTDLYITGHTHTRLHQEDAIEEIIDGKLVKRRRVIVTAGSLMDYFETYGEEKMFAPSFPGLVKIDLDGSYKYVSVTF